MITNKTDKNKNTKKNTAEKSSSETMEVSEEERVLFEEELLQNTRNSLSRSPTIEKTGTTEGKPSVSPVRGSAGQIQAEEQRSRTSSVSSAKGSVGGHGPTKRKRAELGLPGELVDERLIQVREIRRQVEDTMFDERSKINKGVGRSLMARWSETEDVVVDLLIELTRVKAELAATRDSMRREPVRPGPKPTARPNVPVWAAQSPARLPIQGAKAQQPVLARPAVVGPAKQKYASILLRGDSEKFDSSEGVKEAILKTVLPELKSVRVRSVRETGDRGLLVETHAMEDAETLRVSAVLKTIGVTAGDPRTKRPRLLMYDVPVEVTGQDLLKDLYYRNFERRGFSAEKFAREVRYVNRRAKANDKLGSVLLEVDPTVRQMLLAEGRVYTTSRSHRVVDHDGLVRCFKCLDFGHIAKSCKRAQKCRQCGAEGHQQDACPNTAGAPKCANCRARGGDDGHSVMDAGCPHFVRAKQILRAGTDYGG